MRASARRRSYDIGSLRLEDVHELEDARGIRALQRTARVREERLGRPIGPNRGAQRDLRAGVAAVVDVAEDSFPRSTELPLRADGHGAQDLRWSCQHPGGVFQVTVPGIPARPKVKLNEFVGMRLSGSSSRSKPMGESKRPNATVH